ncbi:ribonuclease J [Patescibacteria group bacterium]|nr:MAG: ribonuclease J [Patescibacteria group bacterium]
MVDKQPNQQQPRRDGGRRDQSRGPHQQGGGRFDRFRGRVFTRDNVNAGGSAPSSAPSGAGRPLPPGSPKLRVAVLGGCEEVGRNCTMLEYGNDIIIVDLGLQFPNEDMPGVDYIIPNMTGLKGKEKNVRGVIITHGHYDHIGAIPHVVPKIGNPPIYALPMSAGIIKRRQEDFDTPPLNVKVTKIDDVLQLGVFRVSFFHINHNIPDSAGIVIDTPAGTICHTGDWKFDFHPAGTQHADFQRIAEIGKKGVLMLMGDSTCAGIPGHQKSERVIGDEIERIIEKAPGRVIVGTFASLLSRVKQILESAEKHGKKVALDGFSMKTNVEIAKELGFIKINLKTLIPIDQIDKYPQEKIVVVCTGAQGEKNAALNRIASDEHRSVRIIKGDTVIFSSSVIPGNEESVQRLKDIFYRKRAKVIHKDIMDVHAGGHAMQEDIKLMLALFKPKYYCPIEGNHFLLRENAEVAYSMGWKEENVFVVDNGQVMEFSPGHGTLTNEKLPTDYVFVDGLGVGDVSQVVLRDRQALAEDGMVIVVVKIDKKSGMLVGAPDITSRGFIFMKEHQELVEDVRKQVAKVLEKRSASEADPDEIKQKVRDELGMYLFQQTERRPMILPVVIEV